MATNGQLNGWVNKHLEPELHKIVPNSLYVTFNAPQVDDYHRAIYLTYPPSTSIPISPFSGTLYHASCIQEPYPLWVLDTRIVKDLTSSKSLVLLYRIDTYPGDDMECVASRVAEALNRVPLGKDARTKELGEKCGNEKLGGYDCVIWTGDAIEALVRAGLVNLGDRTVDGIMRDSRAAAGPPDATTMVGVDVGGFRVIN